MLLYLNELTVIKYTLILLSFCVLTRWKATEREASAFVLALFVAFATFFLVQFELHRYFEDAISRNPNAAPNDTGPRSFALMVVGPFQAFFWFVALLTYYFRNKKSVHLREQK